MSGASVIDHGEYAKRANRRANGAAIQAEHIRL
jgi:hypothetical protein